MRSGTVGRFSLEVGEHPTVLGIAGGLRRRNPRVIRAVGGPVGSLVEITPREDHALVAFGGCRVAPVRLGRAAKMHNSFLWRLGTGE